MLLETGRVIAVETGFVWVETLRRSTCGSCAARAGCGQRLLNRQGGGGRGLVRALSGDALQAVDCRVDDRVEIALPEDVVLRGSMVVYATPVVSMLLAVALASAFAGATGDAASIAAALAGLALGLGLVRWHAFAHRDDPRIQPVLQRRLTGSADAGVAIAAAP
ncbi:MAG: SoxR reducing system RseC family protein [Chromatocurvus sp.]